MRRTITLGLLAVIIVFSIAHVEFANASLPQNPPVPVAAATTSDSIIEPAEIPAPAPQPAPVRVSIPAIGLNDAIQNMGVLSNGDLDVPSSSTSNVGWYAAGTVPGATGSAVFDAHVFAAFSKLNELKAGDDIYVETAAGTTLHFVVQETDTYVLADVPLQQLYNRSDQPRLNLITCAGNLTPDHSTYDHRLIVYAVLAQN